MKEFKYVVQDELGLHARPAGLLVKEAAKFKSAITLDSGVKKADAKRIMAVMSMGVKQGHSESDCAPAALGCHCRRHPVLSEEAGRKRTRVIKQTPVSYLRITTALQHPKKGQGYHEHKFFLIKSYPRSERAGGGPSQDTSGGLSGTAQRSADFYSLYSGRHFYASGGNQRYGHYSGGYSGQFCRWRHPGGKGAESAGGVKADDQSHGAYPAE